MGQNVESSFQEQRKHVEAFTQKSNKRLTWFIFFVGKVFLLGWRLGSILFSIPTGGPFVT
jgi:hypothetical protein